MPTLLARCLSCVIALSAAMSLAIPEAHAQDKLVLAREHFERGTAYFKERKYDLALKELMQAYVLDPNPSLVYNIARVHEDMGDLDNAVKFFANFLTIAPKAKNAPAVKKKLAELRLKIERRPKSGTINVETEPSGATVRVDGREIGKSPIQGLALSLGAHGIDVVLEKYEAQHSDIIVAPGAPQQVRLVLRDSPTPVLLTTEPDDATALLLGSTPRPLGRCPCVIELSSGRYKVEVSKPGFASRTLDFAKLPGETLKLEAKLEAVGMMGELVVATAVSGAEVRVDGTAVGRTPLAAPLKLRPGPVTIEIVAPGKRPWRGTTTVIANSVVTVDAVLDGVVQPPRPTGRAMTTQRAFGITTLTLGSVAAATGIALTIVAALDKRSFQNARLFKAKSGDQEVLIREDLHRTDALALEDKSKKLMYASYGLYGAAGALLITGIVLMATDGGGAPGVASGVSILPGVVPGGALFELSIDFR